MTPTSNLRRRIALCTYSSFHRTREHALRTTCRMSPNTKILALRPTSRDPPIRHSQHDENE